jgi:Tfp pilus assembly protein PilF
VTDVSYERLKGGALLELGQVPQSSAPFADPLVVDFLPGGKAIRDYTEVLRLDPARVNALFSRGAAHYSAGEYERAVEDFSNTIDRGAADGMVLYLRALAYQELGRAADARSDMEKALLLDPDVQNSAVPGSPATAGHR